MAEPVVLRTDRLRLAVPDADDVDAILDACQDPAIQRWTTVPSPYTRGDAEQFAAGAMGRWRDGSQFDWAVHDETGLVGMMGVQRLSDTGAELGYWLAAGSRGRGYGREAGREVVSYAFGPLGLRRLEWQAGVGNEPSARLARALGFRYEGTRRGALRVDGGPHDGWIAGLLSTDDRAPAPWPVLVG